MYRRKHLLAGLLITAMTLLVITACYGGARVGELQTKTETIELGDAESVTVEIDMGAGELDVSGGASELLEATFTYNVEELNPAATYSNNNLFVQHEDIKEGIGSFFDLDEYRNEWDLQFNEDVPIEMHINIGAGRSNLYLGNLALTRLDVNAGAGDVSLDLSGSQLLIGLDYDMGAGASSIDLSGDWQADLNGTIHGGLGDLTLRLPGDVGVHIDIDTGVGKVNTTGLSKEGSIYTNDAYGDSDISLNLNIDAGVGNIDLIVE